MTRRPRSMQPIARELHANRRDATHARQADKPYMVLGLTKKGTPYKVTTSDLEWNACDTLAQAEARQAKLEALNPGKAYTIVEQHPEATPMSEPTTETTERAQTFDDFAAHRTTRTRSRKAAPAPAPVHEPEPTPEPLPLTPITTCDHCVVVGTHDEIFRYQCVLCETRLITKPDGATFQPELTLASLPTTDEDVILAVCATAAALAPTGACFVCHAVFTEPHHNGRCIDCWDYFREHGSDRSIIVTEVPVASDELPDPHEAPARPCFSHCTNCHAPSPRLTLGLCRSCYDAEHRQGTTPPAPDQAQVQTQATLALQAKVDVLMALAAQGAEAIAEALRTGRVQVRPARPKVTASSSDDVTVVQHPTAGAVVRNKTAGLETARVIRARLAAGETAKALSDAYGIKIGTIHDIRCFRVYKEPTS